MKAKKLLLFLVPIAVLILEALPYGAVLNFANPEGNAWRFTYSYFSLTPFGYANFGPFLTAILTCTVVLFALIALIKSSQGIVNTLRILSVIGFSTSLMPLLFGTSYITTIGIIISCLLLLEFILTFLPVRKKQ